MSTASVVVPQDAPAASAARMDLFVSTALEYWSTGQGIAFARDVQIDDTAYRRLDPEYYAWLRSRMMLAKRAMAAGQLDAAAFEDLRIRFNAIHKWAVEHFGEDLLREAVRTHRAGAYQPPVAEDDKPCAPLQREPRSAAHHIRPEAHVMVDAIRDQALALGWTLEALYRTRGRFRFPLGDEYGLVCFLGAEDRIGSVTADSIEIIGPPPQGFCSHFYNPDSEHPWKRRVEPGRLFEKKFV